jgi:ketosteroid isomerase-like protein
VPADDTIRKLADLEEIRQLYARYCQAGDSGDCDTLAECFTEDAVLDSNGVLSSGRDEIRRSCESYGHVSASTPMRHVTVNILISVDGDEAQASSYFLLLAAGEQPGVLRTGTYNDRLRHVGGHWCLSERVARSDGGPLISLDVADE